MPDALDLLDEQVHRLGRSVGAAIGGMPGQDLGLPGPHGAGQTRQLRQMDTLCPAVEAVQRGAGCWHGNRGVDGTEQLLALPGRGDLAGQIPSPKASPQPYPSPLGELLLSGQQQLADAVQRIALAAPVAQVACCTRRRTWSTTALASRMAWKWSTTTLACPSGAASALA